MDVKDLRERGEIYGIPVSELSYWQVMKVMEFASKTQPWLEENIGRFGEEWFVVIDKSHDSLRLVFKDDETETYFKLAWMQRDHESG